MKNLLISLQILSCCCLGATELVAESSATQKNKGKDSCTNCRQGKDPCASFQRGDAPLSEEPASCKSGGNYNSPGNIKTSHPWDVHGDISYIFWLANEDGLDLATTGLLGDTAFFPSQSNGYTVFQDNKYSSGFKIGLGANLNTDNWVVDLEYTYLRQTTSTSSTIEGTPIGDFVPDYKITNWFTPQVYGYGSVAPSFSSKWKLALDWLDLTFKRPFYQGNRLVVTPSAGLRVSWIRQNMKISAQSALLPYEGFASADVSNTNSNSWAIGPRGVINTRWLLGMGFRCEGTLGGSLLYTQFTKVSHAETGSVYITNHPVGFSIRNYNCVRPMLEADLGVGYGSYFVQNRYHWDLAVSYDFNYLFGQNMMRYQVDLNSVANTGAIGDLYFQGLTIKTRIDF